VAAPLLAVLTEAARAVIGSSGICGAIIGCAGVGSDNRLVVDRMLSWREASQLDDDMFPRSNYWITFLLVMTEDLLLAWMASITVFAGDPAEWALSWLGAGIHSVSRSDLGTGHDIVWVRHCYHLFSHGGKREGAGLRVDMPPFCPGLSSLPCEG
jgi:hypothetical protein